MRQQKTYVVVFSVLLAFSTIGCSNAASKKQDPEHSTQPQANARTNPPPPTPTPSTADTQPAPARASDAAATATPPGKPSGPPATEKYELKLTNYSKVSVTVSVNGEWLGQWDQNAVVPLQPVIQGKNQVTVELGGKPDNDCTVYVVAKRGNQDVTVMTLSFQGQTGTHTYTFVAK